MLREWIGITTGEDLGGLLFGASNPKLENLDCEKFQRDKVFGVTDSFEKAKSGRVSRWTLGVVNFSRGSTW